jgi:two-component system, OmpR family, sensor histidine kinase KdpD
LKEKGVKGGRAQAGRLEVVSTLGHELRRPLTVIRGAATLLLDTRGNVPERTAVEMLRLIDRGVEDMSDLIEDVLTACHLEAGDLALYPDAVGVAEVVEPVVDAMRLRAGSHPILVLGSAPGLRVEADASRARQALRALVANALRYSPPEGAVEISVHPEGGWVELEVLDRGPGLPEGHVDAAFEPFRRVDQSASGPGLGLFLVRGLAQAMGGSAGYRPRPGGGSAFWFTLKRRGG